MHDTYYNTYCARFVVVISGGTTVYIRGAAFRTITEALLVVTMTVARKIGFEYNVTSLTNFTSDVR